MDVGVAVAALSQQGVRVFLLLSGKRGPRRDEPVACREVEYLGLGCNAGDLLEEGVGVYAGVWGRGQPGSKWALCW